VVEKGCGYKARDEKGQFLLTEARKIGVLSQRGMVLYKIPRRLNS
jgi:hypothetical protein